MTLVLPALSERSILVTGCSSGIGYYCAHALKKRGYRVFASARHPEDVARLRTEGLEAVRIDMQDSSSIHLGVEQVLHATQNKLFGLFNNAGFGQPGALEDISRDALRAQFETNVFGLHEISTAVIPIMRQQGYGRIVQNSSVLGFIGMAYRGAYNASKYAVEGLSDTLRIELADTPLKVSLIQPGPIESAFRKNAYQKFLENIDQAHSYHRKVYHFVDQRLAEGSDDPYTLGPEAVFTALVHALESKNPKIRYRVTKPTKYMAFLKRFCSDRMLDRLLCALLSREKSQLKSD